MPTTTGDIFTPLSQVLSQLNWPLSGFVPDCLDCILTGSPSYNNGSGSNQVTIPFILTTALNLTIPGIDDVTFAIGASTSGSGSVVAPNDLILDLNAFTFTITIPITVNVSTDLLTPVDASYNPTGQPLSIVFPQVGVTFAASGSISFVFTPPSQVLHLCLVGDTGVVVSLGSISWYTPATSGPPVAGSQNLPPNFSGFYLTHATFTIPSLSPLAFSLDYLFIGTGGVTCSVTVSQTVTYIGTGSGSGSSSPFTVALKSGAQPIPPAYLFRSDGSSDSGFAVAFNQFRFAIAQSTFTGLTISGAVAFAFFDDTVVIDITAGLDQNGDIIVAASGQTNCNLPQQGVVGPSASTGSHLFQLAGLFGGNVTIDVDSIEFIVQPGKAAAIDIAGDVQITNSLLTQAGYTPTFGVKGLRIDTSGSVTIDGGWISLPNLVPAQIDGIFPFSISKIGLGKDSSGKGWVGVNGGIKLADGLPIGVSVSGLRFSVDGTVSLEGIGLNLTSPGAFQFSGSAAYFHDTSGGSGFRGTLDLTLTPLDLHVDASLAVGNINGTLYAFLSVDVELPTGIPLFTTGLAFFGFAGLLAVNMSPNRQPDQDWYTGWYLGAPAGVTDSTKWAPQSGAFAIGFGTTLGTLADQGFTASAKVIFVVAIPGPQLIFAGKANFLVPRPQLSPPDAQGTFTALIVFDGVNEIFQADLTANYSVPVMVNIGGSAEIAGAPKYWHFYLGEKTPPSKQLHAKMLALFDASAYLMIDPASFQIGASITYGPNWTFGPVSAWMYAEISGQGEVSLNPAHFDGTLMLVGTAGLNAFGVGISISANATFEAQGPTPWQVAIDVEVELKINLLFFNFDFRADLGFSWSNTNSPQAVNPVLSSGDSNLPAPNQTSGIRCTHPLSTDAIQLSSGPLPATLPAIPPDGMVTLTFSRPVQDLIGIGQAGITYDGDQVGRTSFSYGLAGVAIVNGSGQLVAARAIGNASGNTLTPGDGLGLPATTSCVVAINGSSQNGSISGGVITLPTPPGDGPQVFSIAVAPQTESVTITLVTAGPASTSLTLAAAPNAGWPVYAGGSLTIGQTNWTVLGGSGTTLVVRTGPSAPTNGPASITAPPPPSLRGFWASDLAYLPNHTNPTSMTKLYLWADCPFVYFAYNANSLGPAKPTFTCGPAPKELKTCIDFNSTSTVLSDEFSIGGVSFFLDTDYKIVQSDSQGHKALLMIGGWLSAGFGGVEDIVVVDIGLLAGGSVSVTGYNAPGIPTGPVQTFTAPGTLHFGLSWPKPQVRKTITLRAVDSLEIDGSGVLVYSICFLPAWSQITFSSVFPQESTGSVTYDGLVFNSPGVMSVVNTDLTGQNGVLNVGSTLVEIGQGGPIPLVFRPPGSQVLMASVVITFPQPITRVSIDLVTAAGVRVYAGKTLINAQSRQANSTVSFVAGPNMSAAKPGWFDSIVISSFSGPVQISSISYDGGPFGWDRYQQWQWQTSVQQSVSSLYQDQPVLPPGTYQVTVVTQARTTPPFPGQVSYAPSSYQTSFTIGPPPMQTSDGALQDPTQGHYPTGGHLCQLATYVDSPLPLAGAKPFYRRLDTAVGFTKTYVSAMYLQAGTPLELMVIDANGVAQRSGQQNVWGNAPVPALTNYQSGFIQTLQGSTKQPCASINLSQIVTPQVVSSAGTMLPPSTLLRNELQASLPQSQPTNLYRADFTTSRYGNLRHHLATATGACRQIGSTRIILTAAVAAASDVQGYASSIASSITNLQNAVASNSFDAVSNANTSLASAITTLPQAQAADFEKIEASLPALPPAAPPTGIALTRFDSPENAITLFLLEADEPLPWERLSVNVVGTANAVRRTLMAIDASFGSPATNQTVSLPAASVTSNAELLLVQSSINPSYVTPRVSGATAAIQVAAPKAAGISATVIVNAGGSVALASNPPAASDPGSQGPTADARGNVFANPATLVITGSVTDPVTLNGTGFGLISLDVTAAYVPSPPSGGVRINAVRLPASSADTSYVIDLTFLDAEDISNWTLLWWDFSQPGDTPNVLGVLPAGTKFSEAAQVRWYPSLSQAPADTDVDQVIVGGAGTPPPVTGAILQLQDAAGEIAHEWVAMPLQLSQPAVLVPSSDGTRAFLVVPQVPIGSVCLAFTMNLAETGLPTWSIGGQSPPEAAYLVATSIS